MDVPTKTNNTRNLLLHVQVALYHPCKAHDVNPNVKLLLYTYYFFFFILISPVTMYIHVLKADRIFTCILTILIIIMLLLKLTMVGPIGLVYIRLGGSLL